MAGKARCGSVWLGALRRGGVRLGAAGMSVARWIQLEQLISRTGFVGKHPTTGAAIASPIVAMSQAYLKQANQLWYQIYQIVQENCSTPFKGNPHEDAMERLLSEGF